LIDRGLASIKIQVNLRKLIDRKNVDMFKKDIQQCVNIICDDVDCCCVWNNCCSWWVERLWRVI